MDSTVTASVRRALSAAGAVEFGEPVVQFGVRVTARCGFTVQPASGVSVIVTFQGPPPETRATRRFLASYAKTLTDAGFRADADYAAGYVAVEVPA